MLEFYIASVMLFGLVWGWIGKLCVDVGRAITVGELLGFVVLGAIPIVQQAGILFGIVLLFYCYRDTAIFGGKK